MTSPPVRVEIVAPVHNRKEHTLRCLRSVARLEREGVELHTIIVDDGSTDGTAEAIRREFPAVELVSGDGSLWYTEGTNVGLRAALEHDPAYVLMINDDQIFDSKCLQSLIETARKHPRSVVGALLLLWDTPHRIFQVAPRWSTWTGGWQHWYQQTLWTVPARAWEVELIVGNCVLVPVAAIREAGLMNSRRFPMVGDAEYTTRLRKGGWRLLIEPRARVFCQPNDLPPRLRKIPRRRMFRALVADLRHPHNIRRRFFMCVDTAPSRLQGLVAFCMFWLRLVAGRNAEGAWAQRQPEPPLSEVFADAVVDG